ncbi:MAG: DUF3024 domain-containing protein [Gammaproteobacteria bacterium]|jgi:Protein of unknown function (DUF3024)|nr:DUF3024 domain-containing protein [Gammaproteobacteria bacterium]
MMQREFIDHRGEDSGHITPRARLTVPRNAVNTIPQHTHTLIERLLESYCERVCPPTARNTVLLGYYIAEDHAVIHELKRICGVPGTCLPSPVARFRYRCLTQDWALDYFDPSATKTGVWRRYRPLSRSRSFIELLREFDLDSAGHFWGRLDGKSLRWCSAKGRCIECDIRYKQVLGLAVPIGSPSADHQKLYRSVTP